MKRNQDCEVLIVGAGPTGLTLATALNMRGIRATIIDRQAEGANTSRAAVVHARTLEVLEHIGVSQRLEARGMKCKSFSICDRDRNLMTIGFSHLPTRYPYTLMISQAVTESILLERLREVGGDVLRPRRLASFTQDSDGVEAVLEDGSRLRAQYIVGADGMHSKVREMANIGFTGDSYPQSFLLADVRANGGVTSSEVRLYFSPGGMVVVAPLPDGSHRIVAPVDHAPETPTVADLQALLDERGPVRQRVMVESVTWGSRFRVHHRVADRYREGRVLLAGDAAHVHSPAGGQGMNTGIQDAIALTHALGAALQAHHPTALNTYGTERRPVAERVVSLADRLTRIATVGSTLRPLRNMAIRILASRASFRDKLALQLAGLTEDNRASQHTAAQGSLVTSRS